MTTTTTLSIMATQRHPSLPPLMDNVNMMGHYKWRSYSWICITGSMRAIMHNIILILHHPSSLTFITLLTFTVDTGPAQGRDDHCQWWWSPPFSRDRPRVPLSPAFRLHLVYGCQEKAFSTNLNSVYKAGGFICKHNLIMCLEKKQKCLFNFPDFNKLCQR